MIKTLLGILAAMLAVVGFQWRKLNTLKKEREGARNLSKSMAKRLAAQRRRTETLKQVKQTIKEPSHAADFFNDRYTDSSSD